VLYQYDAAGHIATKAVGNGLLTTYRYDPAEQILNLTNALANGTVISWFNYTYDSRGRRTTMSTLDGNWTYTYDDIGQLTHAVFASTSTIPNQGLTYVYDAAGNRTQTIENGVATAYTVNNLNQYFSVGQTNYTFDADGNLIREVSPAGTLTYTYSDENRLIAMTSPLGTWSYGYDGLGNRVAKTENGTTTRYVIDPRGLGNLVGEYNQGGNLIAHYDYGRGLLARVDVLGNFAPYTFDALGSVQELIDPAGSIQNTYSYSPFGGLLRTAEVIPNNFRFVGRYGVTEDSSTLTYMRARSYSKVLGRFLAADPIGLDGGGPNLYQYAGNNVLSRVDPEGTTDTCDQCKGWSTADIGRACKKQCEDNATNDAVQNPHPKPKPPTPTPTPSSSPADPCNN